MAEKRSVEALEEAKIAARIGLVKNEKRGAAGLNVARITVSREARREMNFEDI